MKERVYVIGFMIVLGLVAAVVLTAANSVLKPLYDANKERESKGNVLIALGIEGWDKERVAAATVDDIKAAFDKAIIERTVRLTGPDGRAKDVVFYEGYRTEAKTAGDLIGYAFKITGAGFWDRISGYLAVDPTVQKVIGITFYEDYETPGLGHKINEPEWQQTWVGRSIHRPDTDMPRIDIVPPGTDLKANQVHAISGATETSGAVQKFLNAQLRDFVAAVKQDKERGRSATP
ncbi:MAG: FMN-binding protein [Verrucomicrobia bacterium]|nr:FMN-binding protein [Verrucomicrobiota bacterium]